MAEARSATSSSFSSVTSAMLTSSSCWRYGESPDSSPAASQESFDGVRGWRSDSEGSAQPSATSDTAYVVGRIDLMKIPWFHPDLKRHQAEAELQQAEPGVYLMRPSYDRSTGELRGFTVDVRCQQAVKHYQVAIRKDKLVFGQEQFKDVDSLQEHFNNHPVIGDNSAKLVVLKHPYPREVQQVRDYQYVNTHFVHGKEKEVSGRDRVSYSLASKEGYLVKMGAVVKSWRKRWFVLRNEELLYFGSDKDKKPIRTLNLVEVSEVAPTEVANRPNVFKLVLPWRTFFLQALSPEGMEDWVRLLQWKVRELQEAQETEDLRKLCLKRPTSFTNSEESDRSL